MNSSAWKVGVSRLRRVSLIGVAALGSPAFSGPLLAAGPSELQVLSAQYDMVNRDCGVQLEQGRTDECLKALKEFSSRLDQSRAGNAADLKAQVAARMILVEARGRAGSPDGEHPDTYYRTMLRAYASIPEANVPYDELVPLWNQFLRTDAGRSKFGKYRKLRLMLSSGAAGKDDKPLEEAFQTNIQERLLQYGFAVQDSSSTSGARPDVLAKVNLKGGQAEDSTDPRFQYKKVFRLTLDIGAIKLLSASATSQPQTLEVEEGAAQLEWAREAGIKKGTDRLANLIFHECLKNMFPPSSGG